MSRRSGLSAKVLAQLQGGEIVRAAAAARQLRVDMTQWRRAITTLRRQGHDIVLVDTAAYRLVVPGANGDAADAVRTPAGRRRRTPVPVPTLGQRLQVVALALERSHVVLRLTDGTDTWSAVLRTHTNEQQEDTDA